MFLRNRFLNSVAFLLSPPGEGDGGGASGDDNNAGGASGDDNNAGGAAGDEGAGSGAGGQGGEGSGGGEGSNDDGSDGQDDPSGDDDDPLAGLSEEQRAKVERHLARETGWRDRQINRLTGKRRSAEEDVEAARTIVERQPGRAPGAAGQQLTQEDIRREAQRLRAQESYDEGCNRTDADGRKYYGENWGKATDRLAKMGGIDQTDMVNILATDNPAVVLHSLAQNPDEYERIMALPPARRNTEFVKLGMKEPPKKGGKAPVREDKRPGDQPPPPTPVQGRRSAAIGQVDLYAENVDDDAWYKARNEQRRKKFSAVE